MSAISWSLAQSHDADLRPGDLFEIRDTETGQVVYRRLIDDSDVERGQFNVPAGVLEDGVMYGHRVKRQSDGGGWSASSVFSLARPPEKSVTLMTLTEFLLARIAEDESRAESVRDFIPEFGDQGEYINPARVLAECEAKRRIVELHSWGEGHECSVFDGSGEVDNCRYVIGDECSTMQLLASVYADHPDFRSEWRP